MAGQSQYIFDLPHAVSYAPEDFVPADSNRNAHAVAAGAAPWAQRIMAITGPEGSGKTHLAHLFAARTGARIIAAAALGTKPADALLEGADCAVLELPDGALAEEALAQFINAALARETKLLVTARSPLAQRKVARPDLASRLKAIAEVKLEAPDDALLAMLLAKGFADRQLRAPEEVITYLVKRIERSGAAAKRAVAYLDARALAGGRALTVPFVRDSMAESG